MATGVVVRFSQDQGRGLLRRADGRFVSIDTTALQTRGATTLARGMVVEFDIVVTSRGEEARNVTVVGRTD
jgi:cold shock CspA family protein